MVVGSFEGLVSVLRWWNSYLMLLCLFLNIINNIFIFYKRACTLEKKGKCLPKSKCWRRRPGSGDSLTTKNTLIRKNTALCKPKRNPFPLKFYAKSWKIILTSLAENTELTKEFILEPSNTLLIPSTNCLKMFPCLGNKSGMSRFFTTSQELLPLLTKFPKSLNLFMLRSGGQCG